MKYFCKKKEKFLSKNEVHNKFHCLRQNFKKGCINLEKRKTDEEIIEECYGKEMRRVRHKARDRERRRQAGRGQVSSLPMRILFHQSK